MIPRPDHSPSPYDDDWQDGPPQGAFSKWGPGVALPLLVAGYGLTCIITRHAILWNRRSLLHFHRATMHLHGANAVALGISIISIALFLHVHYFWGNSQRLALWAPLGKIISLIGMIAGLGYVIVRFFLR